jgi:phosphoribosylanthranilate isomerase
MANKQTTRFEGDVYIASSSEPSIYGIGSVVFEGNLVVNGSATITGGVDASHSSLTGLLSDDHSQYALLSGRVGGQTLTSGTTSGNNLTLRSTSNATKGSIILDETTTSISNTTGSLRILGGIGISNTTDSTSSTNGGTFTTAGGIAVAKKAFVGTDLSIGGNITSGTWNGTTILVQYGGTGQALLSSNSVLLGNGVSGIQAPVNLTFSSNILTTPKLTSNDTTASISSTIGAVLHSGGVSISNTSDATSSTNGGTFTTAGGIAVAKKAYIGTDLSVGGNLTVTGTASLPHGNLTGLLNDNHTQYVLLAGRSGGQTLISGTASGNNLILRSTSNATKGSVLIDETTASTTNSSGSLVVSGGIGLSNTTDATSSINGGTFTTAGGIAIAKKAFIGTDLSIGGNITSGTWAGTNLTVSVGGTGASTLNSNSILLGNGGSTIQAPVNLTFSSNILTTPKLTSNDTTASTSSTIGAILSSGGIGISNTTDAISSINGGTFTTAGGIAVAKKAFIGTDLSVGGNITSGTWAGTNLTVSVGGTGATTLNSNSILLGNGGSTIQAPVNLTFSSNILTTPKLTSNDTTASTTSALGAVLLSGGLSISNTTDAISSSNGGTFTTAGGIAVAKKAFISGVASFGNTIDMNNTKIINLATPTSSTDAVTKSYVDLAIQGLDSKQSVVVATTVSGIIVSSFQNGSVVDGITLVTGNRILIKDQANVDNGVYTVNVSGAPTRATDFQTGVSVAGSFIFIERGTVNADSGWVCSSDIGSDIVGTNTLTFTQFSGAGSITAGTGLTKSGNTLSVNASQTQITAIGTITTGTWNGSTIQVSSGGTGATTLNTNSILLGNGVSSIQAPVNLTFSSNILTSPRFVSNDSTASTSSSVGAVLHSGGISISNVTDAISSTNGGTLTTAGGIAIAKKAFIGTDLSVGGNITSGTWAGSNLTVSVGGTGATSLTANSILVGNGTSTIQAPVNLTFSSNILTTPRLTSNDVTTSTSSSVGAVLLSGGLSISNITDATSISNGGTFTTAGGIAVAKKAFIGTDLSVGGNVNILGNLTLSGTFNLSHSSLTNLLADDHTQYVLLAGRAGGQTLTSGTGAGNNYIIRSTTNVTKGSVLLDETTASTSSISGALRLAGGLGISNTTDATSITNGGTITTAGGASIAKQLFVGTNVTSGSINITNSTQNILTINCQNSAVNPGRILFSNTGGTGDLIISGDGGDIFWTGGGGRALQMGAFHEIRLVGGRTSGILPPFLAGSNASFNTIVQNSNDSVGLRIQANITQTANLSQWSSSGGTIYSFVDSVGNFTIPICNVTNYIQMAGVTAPANPAGGQYRYYTETDGLLKSKSSSGVVTIYQPCNIKGDIQSHNGTTNTRVPVSIDGSKLVCDSTATSGISWNSNAYCVIRDEKTIGTSGGTFTSGAFVTRTLNTIVSYPITQTDISLSSNIITLGPGVYKIEAICPGNRCSRHTARIMNNDLNTVLLVGTVVDSTSGQDLTTISIVTGILTVATVLNIRVEHRCSTTRTVNGLGIASGFQTEVYTQITIEKI